VEKVRPAPSGVLSSAPLSASGGLDRRLALPPFTLMFLSKILLHTLDGFVKKKRKKERLSEGKKIGGKTLRKK